MMTRDNWIKKVEGTLEAAKQIPLWGHPPAFPWKALSERLSHVLQIDTLNISLEKTELVPEQQLLSGMGVHPFIIPLELSPLQGTVLWVISSEDMHKLTTLALYQGPSAKGFSDSKLDEGFYQFLILEALYAIEQLGVYPDFSMKQVESKALPQSSAFCLDISLTIQRQKLWARLICPSDFHASFKSHFSLQKPPLLESPMASEVDVVIRFEAGHTTLKLEEWEAISSGDFIVLDRCSFDPNTEKGTLTLVLEDTPLFQVRLKENSMKILDYAFYYEEDKTMDKSNPEDEEAKEEFLEGQEEFAEEEIPVDAAEESSNHLWSAKDPENHTLEKLIGSKEIPIVLTVEVARLRMNLEKLLQLQPGNVIDLPIHPEQGVDLTIQGQRIARGELIKIGDALGVRILQIKDQ